MSGLPTITPPATFTQTIAGTAGQIATADGLGNASPSAATADGAGNIVATSLEGPLVGVTVAIGNGSTTSIPLTISGKETLKIGATSPSGIDGANLKAWWRADTGVTSDGNGVSSWANQGTLGGNLVQATNAKKPHSGHTIRGQAALSFDGGDVLHSDLAASSWNFLHDGSGCTILVVWRISTPQPFQFVFDTGTSGVGTVRGCALYNSTANVLNVGNGTSNVVTATGKTQTAGFQVQIVRLKTSGSPDERSFIDLGHHYNAAFSNLADAGNAAATLSIGATGADGSPLFGFVSEFAAWGSYLTDEQVDALETYLAERYRYCGDAGA